MGEAALRATESGKVAASDGWFVVNLADAAGARTPDLGAFIPLESDEIEFPQFGINVHLLNPGEPNGMYHSEQAQEAFLVLHGECLLLVEEQERPLRQWDFFHCPPGVDHIIVGAGAGPCAILMVGRRGPEFDSVHYPVSALAARHGASVPAATDDPKRAYAHVDREETPALLGWPPQGRPAPSPR
ncbi:MAG: cupin domain-containing protein [bacterium]